MARTQARILIVDDNKVNVELIRAQLRSFPYELDVAYDGAEALDRIERNPPDLVLLDLMMPKVSGYDVCKTIKENVKTQFIPVIVITALQELDDKLKAIELGADDFLVKPFNKIELTTRIRSLLHMKSLHDDLVRTESILFSLAAALDAKDSYTRGHSERVAHYAHALAQGMSLPIKEQENIRRGALLHDIGKIGVQDAILQKPGPLTDAEMDVVKTHPLRGFEICCHITSLTPCIACIRNHHERFDGGGYPDALTGTQIPTEGMITSIADAYDAMTTDRPYRKGMSRLQAITIFEREQHKGQWDPQIVKIFVDLLKSNTPAFG